MAIKWEKLTVKSQEAVQAASADTRRRMAIRRCCRCI